MIKKDNYILNQLPTVSDTHGIGPGSQQQLNVRRFLMTEQKSVLIHAELKNGGHHKYLWLGNDAFAKLYESWDFDSDEGKFKGLSAFDSTFSYTLDFDDLKIAHDLIGQEDFGDNDTTIMSVAVGDINWELSDD